MLTLLNVTIYLTILSLFILSQNRIFIKACTPNTTGRGTKQKYKNIGIEINILKINVLTITGHVLFK